MTKVLAGCLLLIMLWPFPALSQTYTNQFTLAIGGALNTASNPAFTAPGTGVITEVSPTTGANTASNPFFNQLSSNFVDATTFTLGTSRADISGCYFNVTANITPLTNGQAGVTRCDAGHYPLVLPAEGQSVLTTWNSSTAINTTQIISAGNSGLYAFLVQLDQSSGTFTAGAISFQQSNDYAGGVGPSNWAAVNAYQVIDPTSTTGATLSLPYTLVTSTNKAFLVLANGNNALRIILTTAITGTGVVTPYITPIPYPIFTAPQVTQLSPSSSLPSGTNTIGNITNNTDSIASGTLAAAGTVIVATNGAATITVSATLSGGTSTDTFSIQGQMPDTTWQTVNVYPIPATTNGAPTAQPISQSAAGTLEFIVPNNGFSHVRLNLTALGTGASLAVNLEATQASPNPTADAIVTGVGNTATPVAMQTCQQYAYFDGTAAVGGNAFTSGAVTATSGHAIHICSYTVGVGATATNVGLSTNASACASSGDTKLTPYWQLPTNGGRVEKDPFWQGLVTPSTGVTLCVEASAANPVQAEVWLSVY